MCMYISIAHIDVISHVNISCDRCTIFSLAIRDYWDLGKEGAKDDKFVVLVSFWETPGTVSKMIFIAYQVQLKVCHMYLCYNLQTTT